MPPEVSGRIDARKVRRIARRRINEMKYCYHERLRGMPRRAGQLVVRLTLGPAGRVTDARIQSSTLDSAEVGRCITDAMRRWLFHRPAGGGVATTTLTIKLWPE
jgi:TonB family protein